MKDLQKKEDKIAKVPQSVIHIKHTISLLQYKIWLVVLQKYRDFYKSNKELTEGGFYKFSKKELDDILDYQIDKRILRKDLEKIRQEGIVLSYLEKGGRKVYHGMGFISEWKVRSKTILIKLPSFLEDAMKELETEKAIFQLLNWKVFNHFSGKYEAIIYKLCNDYVGIGRTPYMTIEKIREYMGMGEKDYPAFFEFNRKVIKNPVSKINKSDISDIEIEIEYDKEGRKTKGLFFIVKRKKKNLSLFPDKELSVSLEHIEKMIEMGFSPTKAKQLEKKYGIDNLIRNIKLVEQKKKKGEISKSVSGYLITAIKDDLALGQEIAEQKQREKEKKELEKKIAKEKEEKEIIKKDEEKRKELEKKFYSLSKEEQEEIREKYFNNLKTNFEKNLWLKAKEKMNGEAEKQKPLPYSTFFVFYKELSL